MWFRSPPADLPERKLQRLKCFDYASGAAYFITICTYQRARLFGEVQEAFAEGEHLLPAPGDPHRMMEKWIGELSAKFADIQVDAWVVMPDHVHLILLQSSAGAHTGAPLQEVLKWLKTQTTNEYISGVKSGLYRPFQKSVWQRGYYDHIIRNEQDLQECRKYIQSNPARWLEKHRTQITL